MCVAILTTPGTRPSNAALWAGWTANDDGGGFAYVNDKDKVVVKKGFMKYNDFNTALSKAMDEFSAKSPFLIHMRIATAGHSKEDNTHPFAIKPQTGPHGAMIHNGTLFQPAGDWLGPAHDRKSDTRVVAEALGNILSLEALLAAKDLVGKAVGRGNKLAFLFDNREYLIVNEDSGFWQDGIWYSNNSCRTLSSRR